MVTILHVGVAVRLNPGDGDMVSSVVYNPSGTPLVKRASVRFQTAGYELGVELWSLWDWTAETDGEVAVTLSASRPFVVGIVEIDDAQMPSMFRALADYDRGVGLVLPGYPPGTLGLDVLGLAGAPGVPFAGGATQTQRVSIASGGTAADVRLAMSTVTGPAAGGDLDHDWSWDARTGLAYLAVDARPVSTCLAQSLVLPSDFESAGIELGLLRTGAERTFARCSIYAGTDDAPTGSPLATAYREFEEDPVFRWGKNITCPAGRIWIAAFVSSPVGIPSATWKTQSGDPIATGKLITGECSLHGLDALDVDRAGARISQAPLVKWGAEIVGEDAVFRLVGGNVRTYCVRGNAGVLVGCGSMDEDFDEGGISIPACAWSGEAAGGDTLSVDRDVGDNQVIFSESPSSTPVRTLGTVYWNEVPAADGDVEQAVDDGALTSIGRDSETFGVRGGQSVRVSCGMLLRAIEVKVRKVGSPVNPLVLKLMRSVGSFPTEEVLSTAHVDPEDVPAVADFVEFVLGVGERVIPAALEDGEYAFTLETSGESSANYYLVHGASSDVYAGGRRIRWNQSTQQWTPATDDMAFRLVTVPLTRRLSVDDGTGASRNVARVDFDADIPDGVLITADVEGIEDDDAGTYTGEANALIVRPDAVIHWFASVVGEIPDSRIDLARTFARAAQLYDSLYRFDGVVQDDESLKQLFLRFGFESRSDIDWPVDKLELRFIPLTATLADKVFTREEIVSVFGTMKFDISRGDTSGLATVVRARFDRRPYEPRSLTAYGRTITAKNLAAIEDSRLGERERPELFTFDLIRRADMMEEVAEFWVSRVSRPPFRTVSTHRLGSIALERHDVVAFDLRV